MRELKFRAWDRKQKKMLYGVSIGTIKVWDENASLISHEFSYSEDCIFEQYTGLKDMNGEEIYVGDIVSEHNGDIIGEIIQKPSGEYCIAWIGVYSGSSVLYDELSMCEVIGNVHESNMEELCPKE